MTDWSTYTGDAQEHGSLGLLADELWKAAENPATAPTEDDVLMAFLGWVEERGLAPWPHQEEALMSLAMGNHVILGTPTGSGKSLVALGMHFMALARDGRSYYTAPIKALVSEKFFELVDVFGKEYVGMRTGDVSINATAPIICCTTEILANTALRRGEDADVTDVAMDEFHYYSDRDRGWAWQVPLLTLPKTRFLLMSATLGDTSAIATDLEKRTDRPVDQLLDAPRPVPLTFEYVETPLETTVELALREGKGPIYIVHFSQEAALKRAQALASFGVSSKPDRERIKEAVSGTRFTTAFGKTLRRLLLMGVGVHHAGMLPRYRLLVERLAQQGLLPVICGTDTLGVGINVPIRTVLLTALTKFDGSRMRRLHVREFQQIAGRAGRAGFDDEGLVIAEAPDHEIENARALAKAGDDPKKRRRVKRKQPPKGFVGWNRQTFDHLVAGTPETLVPRMKITHSMVLSEVDQGNDAWERVRQLIEASAQTPAEKDALRTRADEIFATLLDAGVVVRDDGEPGTMTRGDASTSTNVDGEPGTMTREGPLSAGGSWSLTIDLPEDFALDQPLSPFLLAALELLDPQSDTYALDVISMVEATLEDPRQILRVQEKEARAEAIARMKAEGIDYDERVERVQEVTYAKPLEDLLGAAFDQYCERVPWARDFELSPKSVLRDMLETAANFKGYVTAHHMARFEGTLLRYLSDAYRALARTVPPSKLDDQLEEIVSWLGLMVRSIDSSLVDAWESAGEEFDDAPPAAADVVVRDRRAVTVLVRNALFQRVRLAAMGRLDELGELDRDYGYGERQWRQALDRYHEEHEAILVDADARSTTYFVIDDSAEKTDHLWHVRQIFHDPEGDNDFSIVADVDLDETQDVGEAVFRTYRMGFVEDLAETEA